MKIAVDAHILGKGKGGVERYVAELCARLPELAPEDTFIFFINKSYVPREHHPNVRWIRLPSAEPILQRSLFLPWMIARFRPDVLHTQRIAPLWSSCPIIVSMHDILPLTVPEDYRGLRHAIVRTLTGWSAHRARNILTVSQEVRKEIEAAIPAATGKVKVIYNGVDHEMFFPLNEKMDPAANQEYLLYSGAIEPRKNLVLVLEAFSEVCSRIGHDLKLILAGMDRDAHYAAKLRQTCDAMFPGGQVIFTGFLQDSEYRQYISRARMFLAPSRGEGFDLPPLEAMACGIPVICSDIAVHQEIFHGAAFFFQVDSPHDLANAIVTLYNDGELQRKLRQQGMACCRRFDWNTTVCQTLEIYREVGRKKSV